MYPESIQVQDVSPKSTKYRNFLVFAKSTIDVYSDARGSGLLQLEFLRVWTYYMLDEVGEIENWKSLENEEIEVWEFRVWKWARVWGLKDWMRLQHGSLNRLREGARWRTAGERVGVHRAAPRLEFESLRAWSLKVWNPGSLKVGKFERFKWGGWRFEVL